jgi:hypothetical protein
LEQCGIVGKFKDLIKSYPTDRYQWVIIHDHTNSNSYSNWELVKHIPQGSIFDPLFFSLFINDGIITIPSSVEFSTKVMQWIYYIVSKMDQWKISKKWTVN